MSTLLRSSVGCIVILLASSSAWAAKFTVTLSPSKQFVKSGEAPRFIVQVTAVAIPLRIMPFAHRHDLLDNYAKIRVTQRGRNVDVPLAISDPGSTSDSDYELLSPGQSISFEHCGTPLALQKLKPGNYMATVTLQPDWRDHAVVSNTVSFWVIAK